jgi:cation-transporting ATPase 13A1
MVDPDSHKKKHPDTGQDAMVAFSSSSPLTIPCDSKQILGVQLYVSKYTLQAGGGESNSSSQKGKNRSSGRHGRRMFMIRWYHLVFGGLYLMQLYFVVRSIGRPRLEFLERAEREGFDVMEGRMRYKAELEHAFRNLDDVTRRTQKIGWFDWVEYDVEQLVEEKKRDRERNVLDSLPKSMRVPGKYQTSFWPTLFLGMWATLHALVILLQHWSVAFHVALNYRPVDVQKLPVSLDRQEQPLFELDLTASAEVDDEHGGNVASRSSNTSSSNNANRNQSSHRMDEMFPDRKIKSIPASFPTHARIIPSKPGERHVLVELEYYPSLGMTFSYHRRRYYYESDSDDDDEDNDHSKNNGVFRKIRCRTNVPISFLQTWAGFPADHELVAGQIRFGPNLFQVQHPTFTELYKKQLLNPFSVFQIFCVLLWAIDDYIVYSLFSLFMVLMFEGTVVFQRLKSLQALISMGNPSRNVYVHRNRKWTRIDSAQLLPGDILSLTRIQPHRSRNTFNSTNKNNTTTTNNKKTAPTTTLGGIEDDGGDIVPADLLLLRGSTVVNEASLTGESVPQMKEGLTGEDEKEECVAMKGKHKMNVAYAGTKMLQCKGSAHEEENDNDDTNNPKALPFGHIPPPPDGGCVTFVLRTGFASAQGKLVRMIEGSQEKVKGHEKETGLLLALLCVFAIFSSGYVLHHGMQNANRSKYELLLHCILIITSVIRPELPMQMAMAVNQSLMTLMRMHVFCTEPYRVPVAGKLNSCLFDKTGTLTTDELVAVGVCLPNQLKKSSSKNKQNEQQNEETLTPMSKLAGEAALVLAGCHSLVVYDEETTGDPLESAALKSLRWHVSVSTGDAEPAPAVGKLPAGKSIVLEGGSSIQSVHILTRHHFSSKLQRMSCVVKAGSSSAGGKRFYSVSKGSPEAIGKLLANKPDGYDAQSEFLSKQGYRVIALANKPLASDAEAQKASESRTFCETGSSFAGFIAFTCMVRKDTASVLKRLKEGGMSVAMVTGDALLTAIHVAKEVFICETVSGNDDTGVMNQDEIADNPEIRALLESKRKNQGLTPKPNLKASKKVHHDYKPIAYLDTSEKGSLYWRSYDDGSWVCDYAATDIPSLSKRYELAMTGACLDQALDEDPKTGKFLHFIKVFARMTPVAKETVIESLHSVGLTCMMCGDGANDVGALKQADVGVALLSGFSNINAAKTEDDEEKKEEKKDEGPAVTAIMSQEHLDQVRTLPVSLIKMKIKQLGVDPNKYPELVEKDDLVQLYQISARQVAVKRHEQKNSASKKNKSKEELAAERRKEMAERQQRLMERAAELEAQGVSFASFKAMREILAEESKKKQAEAIKTRGVEGSAASLAAQLDELGTGDLPMVKLGDASIAAPFTSKMPSIRNCVDIVRQGRCTLVSSMQMVSVYD